MEELCERTRQPEGEAMSEVERFAGLWVAVRLLQRAFQSADEWEYEQVTAARSLLRGLASDEELVELVCSACPVLSAVGRFVLKDISRTPEITPDQQLQALEMAFAVPQGLMNAMAAHAVISLIKHHIAEASVSPRSLLDIGRAAIRGRVTNESFASKTRAEREMFIQFYLAIFSELYPFGLEGRYPYWEEECWPQGHRIKNLNLFERESSE
jgi:hypothetical protein